MAGLSQMLENPKRKQGIASDEKTVGTIDSLSRKDLALIRPASRRGGKKSGNGSSSSLLDLSQVLEGMNDSGSSFGSDKDMEQDNMTKPTRKQAIAQDDKTIETMDSLSKKDMALIRPASRRGGKKNGSSSSKMDLSLSQLLEDSATSFGSSRSDLQEPDTITMDGTVDSRDCIRVPRTTKRGGRRRPVKEETTTEEEAVEDRAHHKRTISLEDL